MDVPAGNIRDRDGRAAHCQNWYLIQRRPNDDPSLDSPVQRHTAHLFFESEAMFNSIRLLLLPAIIAGLLIIPGTLAEQCPDWFEEIGPEWLDLAPDSPGLQMSIWSPRCNLHCTRAWTSPFENYTNYPPVVTKTPYRLGSVTKPFTAVTVLKLVEDSIIDIHTPVVWYLPSWAVTTLKDQQGAEWANMITPWMLLHHMSGLPEHVTRPAFLELTLGNPDLEMTRREILEWVALNIPSDGAAPGELYIYSDLGYSYLGEVVEHMTNRTLGHEARNAGGWDKLCMHSTYWEVDEVPRAGALPTAPQYFNDLDMTINKPTPYGGSGVISNSEDMVRFAMGFHKGLLLGEEAMNMTYNTVPTNEGIQEYGCGWTWNMVDGREVWFHRGAWSAWMYWVPSLDLALAGAFNQIANGFTAPLVIEDIIQRVAAERNCAAE